MDDTVNTTRENAGHDQLLNVKKGNGGKQLKGNLIEVTRSLHAMFDAENTKECNQPNEILMILSKRGRKEEHDDMDNLTRCMKGLKILAKDHLPMGDDPNIIQGSIKDVTIHWVSFHIGCSTDIIYEHCFHLLPNGWKASLKPETGRLTGFTRHNLCPLGTIHLHFTLISHEKVKKKTTLIDFVVIRHLVEHNIILGRTILLKSRAVPSTMHIIVKFRTTEGSGTVLAMSPRELECYDIMLLNELVLESKKS